MVDEARLNALIGRFVVDLGAAAQAACIVIGEQLGLYAALKKLGETTPQQLADETGTAERYIREWLAGQAAGGYVSYKDGKYYLDEEQALTMADPQSPAYLPGGFQIAVSAVMSFRKIAERFKSGAGFGWHEHDHDLFTGTEKFFRPNYAAHLVSEWIPALSGVREKLEAGGDVADVGCGLGASTILMAKAFPKAKLVGFDYHQASVDTARERAQAAGVDDRVRFEVATAKDFPGRYDFVAFFDSLHDMGDPIGIARHVRDSLKNGGTWMMVEPFANDEIEDNFNPVGRAYYNVSALVCTPASLSQEVGMALGAQAGERRLREIAEAGGFASLRRAAETPFHMVLEASP